MILVAGLGNPGKGYASSRHNIGFIVIDELAKRLGVSVKKKGFRSHYAQAPIDEKKLILLKPDTYMNRSGEAVSEAAEFFKIPAKDVIVVYDEMDLSLGSIKVKVGGGSAGHKGIQSIINSLGDSDFIRVRVGIGKPIQKSETVGHVLSGFEKEEKKLAKELIVRAADAVIEIVLRGAESAMNKFNKKPEVTPKPRKCG
ncbi:MAG: peptidyl-tRNA hydrolase, peptidyl-tRNA hydrolase, PTH1 family [Candidatus Dadabacteria bacterium CSP1-2]|nr:MAG: peptidyl-tRNA hydrolase, peptidyl-tRNA hydrolase, PTH1 family [Candidatus Dadabacteria bacterium CSP1-2]